MEKGTSLLPASSVLKVGDSGQEAGLCPTHGRVTLGPSGGWDCGENTGRGHSSGHS